MTTITLTATCPVCRLNPVYRAGIVCGSCTHDLIKLQAELARIRGERDEVVRILDTIDYYAVDSFSGERSRLNTISGLAREARAILDPAPPDSQEEP